MLAIVVRMWLDFFLGSKHRTCSALLKLSAALIRLQLASTNDESKLFYYRYTMSLRVIADNEEGAINVLPENFFRAFSLPVLWHTV